MSGDKKITQLPTLATPASEDLIHIVDNPGGTPVSKKISLQSLFGNINSNTAINANLTVMGNTTLEAVVSENLTSNTISSTQLTVTGNKVRIAGTFTPGASNLSDADFPIGTITYDSNYLYIKVSTNLIKRVALSSF